MSAEIQRAADRLGTLLGRPIGVDDTRLRLIAYTSVDVAENDDARSDSILNRRVDPRVVEWLEAQRPEAAEGVFVVPARPDLGLDHPRWGAVARADGRLVAYVWVLVAHGELDDEEKALLLATAETVGETIARQHLVDELRTLRERDGLGQLLAPELGARRDAVERILEGGLFDADVPSTAIVVLQPEHPEMGAADLRRAMERGVDEARMLFPDGQYLATVRPGHAFVLVARPHGRPELRFRTSADIARALEARFSHVLGFAPTPRIGIGRRAETLDEVHRSYREALQAAEVSSAIRGLGSPLHHNRLGVYRRIAHLAGDASDRERLHPGIRELLEREREGDPLARTLEVYLDSAGDAARSAAQLHLHRASLYGRIRRIEELATLDLSDGQDRLVAHLEIKLARLMEGRADAAGATGAATDVG